MDRIPNIWIGTDSKVKKVPLFRGAQFTVNWGRGGGRDQLGSMSWLESPLVRLEMGEWWGNL